MTKVMADVARDALDLPAADRGKLARILLEALDLDADFSPDAESAWEIEIARRLRGVETGTLRSRPASEVFSDLDRRFP
jgi:hypothetical protein